MKIAPWVAAAALATSMASPQWARADEPPAGQSPSSPSAAPTSSGTPATLAPPPSKKRLATRLRRARSGSHHARRSGALGPPGRAVARLLHDRVAGSPPAGRGHQRGRARRPAQHPLQLLRVRTRPQGGHRPHRVRRLRLQPERRRLRLLGRRLLQGQRSSRSRLFLDGRLDRDVAGRARPLSRQGQRPAQVRRRTAAGPRLLRPRPEHPAVRTEPLRRGQDRCRSAVRLSDVACQPDRRGRWACAPCRSGTVTTGATRAFWRTSPPASFPCRLVSRAGTPPSTTTSSWLSIRGVPIRPRDPEYASRRRRSRGATCASRRDPGGSTPPQAREDSGTSRATGASSACRPLRCSPIPSAPVRFHSRSWPPSVAMFPRRARSPRRCRGSSLGAWWIGARRSPRSATSGPSRPGSPARCKGPWATSSASTCRASTRRLLRFSGAFGIESDSSPDSSFELILGFGTETFEHGAQIDSLRLAVGITRF